MRGEARLAGLHLACLDRPPAVEFLMLTMCPSRCLLAAATLAMLLVAAAPAAAQDPHLPELSLEELLGVQVQPVFGASERLQPVTEAPASVTIITADDIRRYGYTTLADILRGVRGFQVTNDRNYSYVAVRGFGLPGDYNTRVLLLVNGHRINDNLYDQASIGGELGLDVAMIARVEIIRGPASSLYGTSAFFAVVNIITQTGDSLTGASLDVDLGTLGTAMARASAGRVLANGVSFVAAARAERSRGMDRLYFPEFDGGDSLGIAEDLDAERELSAYGQLQWSGLTLTGTAGTRRRAVPTASYGSLFNSQDPKESTTDTRVMLHASYARVARATRLVANLSFDHLAYRGTYPYEGDVDSGEPAIVVNDDGADGTRWGASLQGTRALPWRQTFTAGGEATANVTQRQWTRYVPDIWPGIETNASTTQAALYVQDEIRVRPWLLLNGGLRHDRYQRFARTTPRAAVIVIPTASQSFKYLYGRAFRAPNAYELHYYPLTASDALLPESIATHEFVWEQYAGEWLRTSVSAYRSNARDLIVLREIELDPSLPTSFSNLAFANHGELRAHGFELEAEVRTKRGLQLLGSATIQNAIDESNVRLVNSPAQAANLRGSAPLFGGTWSAEVQYLGERKTLTGEALDTVFLAHASLSVPLGASLTLAATVRNLFAERYLDPASPEHDVNAIEQNGRALRVGVRWSLARW